MVTQKKRWSLRHWPPQCRCPRPSCRLGLAAPPESPAICTRNLLMFHHHRHGGGHPKFSKPQVRSLRIGFTKRGQWNPLVDMNDIFVSVCCCVLLFIHNTAATAPAPDSYMCRTQAGNDHQDHQEIKRRRELKRESDKCRTENSRDLRLRNGFKAAK